MILKFFLSFKNIVIWHNIYLIIIFFKSIVIISMKKILTFILLLSALSVGCFFPTVGAFAMSNMNSDVNHEMNHEMWCANMLSCDSIDEVPSMHECCESPFIDSIVYNRSSSHSDQDESEGSDTHDLNILSALHKKLTTNSLHRLNSPPIYWAMFFAYPSNTYTGLVGIIRNNS